MAVTETLKPFTEDFARRMERATEQAEAKALTGVLVTPGPDLMYFGYEPIAITERITMLVLQASREAAMIVPVLERPDAEASPGAAALSVADWSDGTDPYAVTAKLLDQRQVRDLRLGVGDARAWPAGGAAGVRVRVDDERATDVACRQGRGRARTTRRRGAAADAGFEQIRQVRFAGRRESELAAELAGFSVSGHSAVEFTVVGSGPNGANPTTSSASA